MVGNDVIDINQTKLDSNWKRKGFLEKVFDNKEQKIINESPNPFNAVWSMWSMKESAYKLYIQKGEARFFNPTKIHCQNFSLEKGIIHIDGMDIFTQTITNQKYIFTYASLSESTSIENHIFHLSSKDVKSQSKQTHQQILQHISHKKNLDLNQLQIKKTPSNIPKIFHKEQELNIPISLTHHGNFGAFTIVNKA